MDDTMQRAETVAWQERLRERRKAYGVSQKTLAERAEIVPAYLSRLENGKRLAGKRLLERLERVLDSFAPDKKMKILVDYVRVRFPTDDERHIIEDVMGIRMEQLLKESHALYGYSAQYSLGGIVVMISAEKEKGTLVELNESGCREFETYLDAQHRTWSDFLRRVEGAQAVWKQFNIVLYDRAGILDVAELAEKCRKGECISRFNGFHDYLDGSQTPYRGRDFSTRGRTLLLGSLKSDICFCIYEDKDSWATGAGAGNHFEIRLKEKRAQLAIEDLLENENAVSTVFHIINHYVRFVDCDASKKRRYWGLSKRWGWFLTGEEVQIKLSMKPEPSPQHKEILKQQALTIDEMIVPDREDYRKNGQ